MKIKTSITLSQDVLHSLKALGNEFKNRSEAIEAAIWAFLEKRRALRREKRDLIILNKRAKKLNREADDVLDYQVDL